MSNNNRYIKRRKTALAVIMAMIIIIILSLIIGYIAAINKNYTSNNNTQQTESSTEVSTETTLPKETTTLPVTSETTEQPAQLTDAEKKQYVLDHPEEYTDELIEFMNKYDQVIDYVYNYKNRDSLIISANTSGDKTDTAYPLLIQWDARWGYGYYGDSLIGVSGCGPACLSMVYRGLTGNDDQTPATVCKLSEDKGYYVAGVGTSWDLMTEGAKDLGLQSQELSLNENKMIEEIQNGHPIICSMRKGDFTKGGHFIVITGYKDDKFIVNDPNSRENSSKLWDYSVLEPQIKNLWSFSK